ncbi:elongation of very long chain fatty acids protein 7 [Caerostris darwini]|uniref:Elongation of very long chain fatty acids protein n=1 Tax=Caerostris darwini TaxID=1538125 RepID=A0AAV4U9J5_9ARAC|nr:elongation of very long chain fatty acids protein 7 [Caerostris darwini]
MSFAEYMNEIILESDVRNRMEGSVKHAYWIIFFYIIFVKLIGPAWMKNRKPFDLKRVMIVYNFLLSTMNLFLSYQANSMLIKCWHIRCMNPNDPEYYQYILSLKFVGWGAFFEKFLALLDTCFFVLRKKDNKVSFLHVFHHSVMCVISIWLITALKIGFFVIIAIGLNTFVHFIMYFYYGLAAFGKSMQKYLWWKKYLTILQIGQFIIMFIYMTTSFSIGCQKIQWIDVICYVFNICILALFINFYKHAFKNTKKLS